MNLLGAALYDPAVAVSKATSSLLAMTAFDTTNLRVAVTIPAHGIIYVRVMGGAVTGATTVPTLLLGLLNGATVIARITPQDFPGTMNAASQSCPLYAEFVVTGLTPGAMNLDLAYAVQVLVASTNIKYGGPNTNAGANAWGGISFQVWDPRPMQTTAQLLIDANGRVDVSKVSGTTQTARDLGASVLLSTGTGTGQLDFTSGVVKANLAQILGTALTETAGQIAAAFKKFFDKATPTGTINSIPDAVAGAASGIAIVGSNMGSASSVTAAVTVGTNNDKTGYALSSGGVQAIWDALTSALTTASSIGKRLADFITGDAYVRLGAPAGASHAADVAAVKTDSAAVKTQTDKLAFTVTNQIDANVLDWKSATAPAMTGDAFARLGAPAGASVSADIASVKTDTTHLKGDIQAQTGDAYARLGSPAGASVSSDIAGVKTKTDNLPSDPADESLIIAATDAIMSRLGSPAGASVSADVAAVKADTAAVLEDTGTTLDGRIPAALSSGGNMKADLKEVNDTALLGNGAGIPWGPA